MVSTTVVSSSETSFTAKESWYLLKTMKAARKNTQVTSRTANSMVMACSSGQMAIVAKLTGFKTKSCRYVAKVSTHGKVASNSE